MDERKGQVCELFVSNQPVAQEQVARRGDLPGLRAQTLFSEPKQNGRSGTIKENATQCKTLHYVIYMLY